MHIHSAVVAISAALLAGCASAPRIDQIGDLPDATTFTGLYDALDTRISNFKTQWVKLESTQWHDAEWIAGGGGVSAAGVAARSTPFAAAGAALAGAVAIVDKFYGVDKQNLAWTKAAHGLRCIKAVSTYIYVNANHLSLVDSPDNSVEGGEAFARRTLRTAMQQVDNTLEDRLRYAAVSSEPNWSAFQTAVRNAATLPAPGTKSPPEGAKGLAPSKAELDKLAVAVGRYRSDVDACLAAN